MQEAPAPPLPVSPSGSLEPGLSSAFADLLEPPGARKMKRAPAEQGPERPPFPLELTLWAYLYAAVCQSLHPVQAAGCAQRAEAAPDLRTRPSASCRPASGGGRRAAAGAALGKRTQADACRSLEESVQGLHVHRAWPELQPLPTSESAQRGLDQGCVRQTFQKP